MTIKGWKAVGIIMLSGYGAGALAKEAKDAYFKHKLIKTGEAMSLLVDKVTSLNEKAEEKEEEVQ